MSTKTTFKRIALVAVAALGFGVLSAVPSSATLIQNTLTISSATGASKVGETATATLSSSIITGAAQDSITVTAVLTSKPSSGSASAILNIYDSSTGDGSNVFASAATNSTTNTG